MDFTFSNYRLITLILLNVGLSLSESTSCIHSDFESCQKVWLILAKNIDLMFPSNNEDFVKGCRTATVSKDCLDNYVKKCAPSLEGLFNEIFIAAFGALTQACEDPKIKAVYLNNTKCYKGIYINRLKCGDQHKGYFKTDDSFDPSMIDQYMKNTCCLFSDYKKCTWYWVKNDCGESASELVYKYNFPSPGLFLDYCIQNGATCGEQPAVVTVNPRGKIMPSPRSRDATTESTDSSDSVSCFLMPNTLIAFVNIFVLSQWYT